mmetsp:Transcript_4048/g.10268  ORF Transcript_4048/g.10268 Transcript_4048/m.10268 type:complete len:463 (+) Transcript_4048:52-1440(+)
MHAHFDCFSGAAGDMMLAACLDAADSLPYPLQSSGRSRSPTNGDKDDGGHEGKNSEKLLFLLVQDLEGGLPELKGEFELSVKRVWRGMGRIAAKKVDVQSVYDHEAAPVPGAQKMTNQAKSGEMHHSHEHAHQHAHQHDHQHNFSSSSASVDEAMKEDPQNCADMNHHSHDNVQSKAHSHSHDHSHNRSHSHNHGHSHDHKSGGKLRNLPQIAEMLRSAPPQHIPRHVASLAIEAFTALAHAEMHTHGAESIDQVHFHEVGAVDSIVDTVGTLLALHYLGVDLGDGDTNVAVTCSPLPFGEGSVWTDHGLLPVPAPATMRLMIGMPTCPGPKGVTGELVTPTAAALLRVLTGVSSRDARRKGSYWQRKEVLGRPPTMVAQAVGLGAGSKDFERHPNILRLILGGELHHRTKHGGSETAQTEKKGLTPTLDQEATANSNEVSESASEDIDPGEGKKRTDGNLF